MSQVTGLRGAGGHRQEMGREKGEVGGIGSPDCQHELSVLLCGLFLSPLRPSYRVATHKQAMLK